MGFWQWHTTNRITWLQGSVYMTQTVYRNGWVLHICCLFMPELNVNIKNGMMCKPWYFTIIFARTDQLMKCCLLHLLSDTLLYTPAQVLRISPRQTYLIHRSVPRPNKTRAVLRLKVHVCSLLQWMLRSYHPLSALPSQCLPATRSLAEHYDNLYPNTVDI